MSNFKDDILGATAGEPIEAIVIGQYDWSAGDERNVAPQGLVIPWSEAAPLLDYEYCDGFGGAECHPIVAWTKNFVLSVHEYDGSTRVVAHPRNPAAHLPEMC